LSEELRLQKRATIILKWFAIGVASVAVILGAYYAAFHPAEASRELARATTKTPDAYTELYFGNPEELPSSITADPTTLPVTFVIVSHEPSAMEYTYRVTFKDAQDTSQLPDGKLTLQPGESKAITQSIAVPAGRSRGEVSVQIINKSQSLRFWLERL
jgi:hypothetical protein